jgi:hypothetical protein
MLVKKLRDELQKAEGVYQGLGFVAGFFSFWQGRSTFFGILFAATGLVFASVGIWGFTHGKDLTSFASFVMAMAALNGSIQAMIVAHSAKEDWNDVQNRKLNVQQAQNDKQSCNPPSATTVQVQVAPNGTPNAQVTS